MKPALEHTYWHLTLQGKSLPIHENDPQEGWYRTRPRKGYRSLPVRIWRDQGSGALLALRDGKRVDPFEVWTWCCLNPVSVEAYEAVLERCEDWPDEIGTAGRTAYGAIARPGSTERRKRPSEGARPVDGRAADMSGHTPSDRPVAGLAGAPRLGSSRMSGSRVGAEAYSVSSYGQVGHNSRQARHNSDPATPAHDQGGAVAEALADEIASLWSEVTDWLERIGVIDDQVTADRCANFADAFASFEKQAEELRTTTKKPVLDQGRAIDAKWKPIVTAADEAKRSCKKALEPFLIAETARIERDAGVLGRTLEGAKAGTFGRTISLRRVRRVSITDQARLIAHYHGDARLFTDETVQKLLVKLAEIDLQSGRSVPGAELTEEQVAA